MEKDLLLALCDPDFSSTLINRYIPSGGVSNLPLFFLSLVATSTHMHSTTSTVYPARGMPYATRGQSTDIIIIIIIINDVANEDGGETCDKGPSSRTRHPERLAMLCQKKKPKQTGGA